MRFLRKIVYKLGFRPKPSSLFYSPSRAWWAGVNESAAAAASAAILEKVRVANLRKDLGLDNYDA